MSLQGLELPTLPAAPAAPGLDEAAYRRLAKRARTLSWLSLAWMTVEGAVAITAGLVASSIALSRPKPTRAIDEAAAPAAIATAPSTVIQARLSHDSVRARRASRR